VATHRVLVAFASEQGSTAEIAKAIARTLRERGLDVDCLPATSVGDVTPYESVVLGSGVFLPRRVSDGQGFLPRHAAALRGRPVWLFASGPLGQISHPCTAAADPGAPGEEDGDSPIAQVARKVGARGLASFGVSPNEAVGSMCGAGSVAHSELVRGWAMAIAADLAGTDGGSLPQ
jgi:menaquinone-dependent protoporphyrinogen oxidase